jgi:hypothetical protein
VRDKDALADRGFHRRIYRFGHAAARKLTLFPNWGKNFRSRVTNLDCSSQDDADPRASQAIGADRAQAPKRAAARDGWGHGSEFDVELSPAVHFAMHRAQCNGGSSQSYSSCGGKIMRNTLILAFAGIALLGCEHPTAPKVTTSADITPASSATTFSGEATVVQATIASGLVSPITLVHAGPLGESGGAEPATLLTVAITKEQTNNLLALNAEVGHASTVGQGNRSGAEATVATLSVDVAGNAIQATFLQALATAVCDAATGAVASGSSTINDLSINGLPYHVGTDKNQLILDLPALRVVANEQKTSGDAKNSDITVNALHVTAYTLNGLARGDPLADVVIASAHADIHCGLCTDQGNDFTTGGGWINGGAPPQARKYFAVAGGYKNGWWGHLTYSDKAADLRVKGTGVTWYQNTPTANGNLSTITGTGELPDGGVVFYTVRTEDNGEPGDMDTFHIKLTGAREYDSDTYGTGVLGGGNIQFHDRPSPCP